MNRRTTLFILGGIALIIVVATAWYLISPLWRTNMLNEASPLATREQLSEEQRQQFEEEEAAMAGETNEMDEEEPLGARLLAQGDFIPADHEVAGSAALIEDGDEYIVRFEDFETVNGPNLHIWLATDTSGRDYVDLGPLKATHGNVNYEVPAGTDVSVYDTVLVWCVPFRVLFSYAQLQ